MDLQFLIRQRVDVLKIWTYVISVSHRRFTAYIRSRQKIEKDVGKPIALSMLHDNNNNFTEHQITGPLWKVQSARASRFCDTFFFLQDNDVGVPTQRMRNIQKWVNWRKLSPAF